MESKRFEVLDSFRGLFALCVVVFHMHYVGSITELSFFRGSELFVEFFFILSGFVLTHGYAFKENLSFKVFAISRVFRLFPLHITMLVVFIFFEFGKLLAANYGINFNSEPFSGSSSTSEIIPNLFLLQSWTSYTTQHSFNYPSWSISIELYMYMVFYAMLFFRNTLRYIFWVVILLGMVSLIITEHNLLVSAVTRGFSGFFAGSLTYVCYKYTHSKIKIRIAVFTLLEFFLLAFVVAVVSSKIGHKSLIASLIFCVSILIFSFEKGLLSDLLKKKPFVFVGRLSYSIYMVHAAILFCITSFFILLEKLLGMELSPMIEDLRYLNFGNTFLNNIFVAITLLLVVFISSITNKTVEKRGQKLGRKIISNIYR